MKRFAALILICSLAVASPSADNWPQFRGPQGGVVADDPDLPESWSQVDEQRATSAIAELQDCRIAESKGFRSSRIKGAEG